MISSKEELEMYKKKKVEISFEVVEWVDDESEYGSNVNEWLGHLKDLVNCLDYRAEYEVEGYGEYEEPIYRKLKSTEAKIEVTEAGFLTEDAINKDELWERYGDSGYYQFKAFDTFTNKAEEIVEDVHGVSYDDMMEIGDLARKIADFGV